MWAGWWANSRGGDYLEGFGQGLLFEIELFVQNISVIGCLQTEMNRDY